MSTPPRPDQKSVFDMSNKYKLIFNMIFLLWLSVYTDTSYQVYILTGGRTHLLLALVV